MTKKKISIIIAILVIVIGGAIAYVALQPKERQESSAEVTGQPATDGSEEMSEPTQQPEQTDEAAKNPGQYVNYDGKAIETTPGRKLIFFHAAWCPQCRELEQSILDGKIPDNVTIFKANYDLETGLKQRYGVTQQTTFVEIDDQGNEIKEFNAYSNPTLQAVIDAFKL